PAIPEAALYPARVRKRPSPERLSAPSEVAVPLHVRGTAPAAEGIGTVLTRAPAGVRSSRNIGVLPEPSAAVPSPTRTRTRLPRVNCPFAGTADSKARAERPRT